MAQDYWLAVFVCGAGLQSLDARQAQGRELQGGPSLLGLAIIKREWVSCGE